MHNLSKDKNYQLNIIWRILTVQIAMRAGSILKKLQKNPMAMNFGGGSLLQSRRSEHSTPEASVFLEASDLAYREGKSLI